MSYLNFGVTLLIAEQESTTNPTVRVPDISVNVNKVPVSRPKTDEIVLQPGDSETIATTVRTTSLDNTTQFAIQRPYANADIIRLVYTGTGTAPSFRTRRAIGVDATSSISITRVAPNTVRVSAVAGTAINSAAVQVGDILKFEPTIDAITSPFSVSNTGVYYKVQSKGTGYIDILDNGGAILDSAVVLGANFDFLMSVFSPGNVRQGDVIQVSGINIGNVGKYQIINLSHNYVEFLNPLAVSETFTNNSNVVLFDRLIGFLMVRSRNCPESFTIRINNADAFRLTPVSGEAIFAGSISAHTIEAVNDGSSTVTISLVHATVME